MPLGIAIFNLELLFLIINIIALVGLISLIYWVVIIMPRRTRKNEEKIFKLESEIEKIKKNG